MSSRIPWDPFIINGEFCLVSYGFESIVMVDIVEQINAYDPVTSDLMSMQISNIIFVQLIITHVDNSDDFRSISAINSKRQDIINLEKLSSWLYIGLKTAARTLKATTHQYIRTKGLFAKTFRTDNSASL